jgi:hypothetical protein
MMRSLVELMTAMSAVEWTQDGSFEGTDGRPVRAYDDVVLFREIEVEGGFKTNVETVPIGTIATVLFFTPGPDGIAQLECYVGEEGFTFGYCETNLLRLHMTNEEKYGHEGDVD